MATDEPNYLHDILKMVTDGQNRLADELHHTNEILNKVSNQLVNVETRVLKLESNHATAGINKFNQWLIVGSVSTSLFTLAMFLAIIFGKR